MAALLGVGLEAGQQVAAAAAQGEVCEVANDNGPGQVIISGAKTAVGRAAEAGKALGVRRFMPLNVSAPFHCALMQPAALAMQEALAHIEIKPPAVPLVANVTAAPVSDPAEIRKLLVAQVTSTVRWRESVMAMAKAGVTAFYEIGSGKVLTGLVRGIDRSLKAEAIGTPADLAAALPGLTA
jgi:[acyl-carrier-protein] S-malonyltransferase